MVISPEDQPRLIALTRHALEARVRHGGVPEIDASVAPDVRCGAFVSIFHDGELRGCLGRLNSPLPIARLVAQLAQAVADSDPRFPRVTPQELDAIDLEISVLTTEREIQSVEEIVYGMLRTNRVYSSKRLSILVRDVDGRRLVRSRRDGSRARRAREPRVPDAQRPRTRAGRVRNALDAQLSEGSARTG